MVPRNVLVYSAHMEERKKVVAYIRISSMRQVGNESPTTQRVAIERYAEQNNLEIVAWYEDIAQSGKNADRSGLQALLKYCLAHSHEVSHWLVYNMRRASRDNESYTTEVKLVLRVRGITVRSATEPAVDDTKEGRFMETLLVALGQLDNEGKAEVTIDNMRSLAMQGYYQHPPVVGYSIHKTPNDAGRLRPTLKPNEMSVKVADVLERFSQGDITKADLTRYATDVGLRSRYGKKLSKDSINRLLKNPTYAGYVSDNFTNFELVPGKHEPLISIATFERNQALLYPKSTRLNEVHTTVNKEYPLKGSLLCPNCGEPMYASAPRTGNGGRSPRYHCSRKECRGKVKSVKTQLVHAEFRQALTKLKPSEGVLRLYKTILMREANNALGNVNKQIGDLRSELGDIDETRLKTLQKFTDDAINKEEKDQLVLALDTNKTNLMATLHDLEQQQYIREADIDLAIQIMTQVDEQWA